MPVEGKKLGKARGEDLGDGCDIFGNTNLDNREADRQQPLQPCKADACLRRDRFLEQLVDRRFDTTTETRGARVIPDSKLGPSRVKPVSRFQICA